MAAQAGSAPASFRVTTESITVMLPSNLNSVLICKPTMVDLTGFAPATSSMPLKHSTTELQAQRRNTRQVGDAHECLCYL